MVQFTRGSIKSTCFLWFLWNFCRSATCCWEEKHLWDSTLTVECKHGVKCSNPNLWDASAGARWTWAGTEERCKAGCGTGPGWSAHRSGWAGREQGEAGARGGGRWRGRGAAVLQSRIQEFLELFQDWFWLGDDFFTQIDLFYELLHSLWSSLNLHLESFIGFPGAWMYI